MRPTGVLLFCVLGGGLPLAEAAGPVRPNVLFLTVDDLRPELPSYGAAQIITPHLDRLARGAVQFDRAYCMVPTCGASRASLLTGVRPSRGRFVGWRARADREAPWAVTMPAWFRRAGYHTVSLGKVFNEIDDSLDGWAEAPWRSALPDYRLPANQPAPGRGRFGAPTEAAAVEDDAYRDGDLAKRAVADLRRLAATGRPFFLAVGFEKPHLPMVAPQRYWDLYDPAKVRLPDNYHPPAAAPPVAIHNWGELRSYADVPAEGPLADAAARELIRGYYASVSYVDAQVGKVLDELDRLGLAGSTIVILWGDHGWNLGEHSLWCKHSCFEVSMRVPLLVRAPGIAGGTRVSGLAEMIDVYPTLCELAGVPVPEGQLAGSSLAARLRDPSAAGKASAVGRFQEGDTIRTERYRFTEYSHPDGSVIARMLYDHDTDPAENRNVAGDAAYAPVVAELTARLHREMGRDRPAR